jgi:hypothetical protein
VKQRERGHAREGRVSAPRAFYARDEVVAPPAAGLSLLY